MKKGEDRVFSKRQAEDRELSRRLDLMEFERMLKELPTRERAKKRVLIGDRAFSMKDMLEEISAGNTYSDFFRGVLTKMRFARLRASKK